MKAVVSVRRDGEVFAGLQARKVGQRDVVDSRGD